MTYGSEVRLPETDAETKCKKRESRESEQMIGKMSDSLLKMTARTPVDAGFWIDAAVPDHIEVLSRLGVDPIRFGSYAHFLFQRSDGQNDADWRRRGLAHRDRDGGGAKPLVANLDPVAARGHLVKAEASANVGGDRAGAAALVVKGHGRSRHDRLGWIERHAGEVREQLQRQ